MSTPNKPEPDNNKEDSKGFSLARGIISLIGVIVIAAAFLCAFQLWLAGKGDGEAITQYVDLAKPVLAGLIGVLVGMHVEQHQQRPRR